MNLNITKRIENIQNNNQFSGTVIVKEYNNLLADVSYGFSNRSEQLRNQSETRYGIASGCKLFTSIAICQLVEKGDIKFDSTLRECLDFPFFDENITIHQLLTHTSGIPDYFDEEEMDDYEELWIKNPMYHIRNLRDFLPLFQDKNMKNIPGAKFHYNNAGYVLLGLVVEQVSGLVFTDYIEEHIFQKACMKGSGYFESDLLPEKTALGYIDQHDGTWKTNIFSLPAKGGSDGGAFVTAQDMGKLWEALIDHQLLSEDMTNQLLTPHIKIKEDSFCGYGIWIKKNKNIVLKYHVMGYDPGVSFHSAFYPKLCITVVVCSNKSAGAFEIMNGIEEEIQDGKS